MHITDKKQIEKVLSYGVTDILPDRDSLAKLMIERKIRLYLGIDPTGSLLTLGHSIALRKLQQFAELGHQVILLIGNGTVKIGDPTGKDASRPTLTDEQINENFKNWKRQASKVLDFDKIELRHNGDWLDKLTYSDIIKLMAKTTVSQLLERDMFQERIKNDRPIHAHELIYPLMQGYDSVVMDVDLEIGGTDQTFNMMMGRYLQKVYNNKEKWVLSTPLINGTDGRKMSKSLNNYIAMTEVPTEMYGKLMSIADTEIIPYFESLTNLDRDEIVYMDTQMKDGKNPIEFKKNLALTITKMYHPENEALLAQDHFESTVQAGDIPDDLPEVKVGDKEVGIIDLLNLLLPQESRSNLRRLVEQGAVELIRSNDKPSSFPTDPHDIINPSKFIIARVGKRRYFKLNN